MKKLQFFILVETILLTLALVTILSGSFSRLILFLVLFLLGLYYYFGKQRLNFLLVSCSFLLFFIVMLNPYVLAAICFAIFYGFIVLFPYLYGAKRDSHLDFEEEMVKSQEKNRWLGSMAHFSRQDSCRFKDINLFRLVGEDTIYLHKVIVLNHDNVIVIRKLAGNTRILLPADVAIQLNVNHFYGTLRFLDQPLHQLRNEHLVLESPDFAQAPKSVKLVLASFVGDVEVVRT